MPRTPTVTQIELNTGGALVFIGLYLATQTIKAIVDNAFPDKDAGHILMLGGITIFILSVGYVLRSYAGPPKQPPYVMASPGL